MSDTTALEKKIIERINRDGAMSFRDFMQLALYDAELGYYNTERLKIGATGDYYTSSNVHPAFGAILAQVFVRLWKDLSSDNPENANSEYLESDTASPLNLVEMGAGTGQLAFDVLSALRDEHAEGFARANYTIIEQSPVMRARQQEKLNDFSERVCWQTFAALKPTAGIFFSNELVDAMPVHRLRFTGETVEELYVIVVDESHHQRLAVVWGALSKPQLVEYLKRSQAKFFQGQMIEVNLDAIHWLWEVSRVMEKGFLVTLDYGDLAPHLYSVERLEGTLRCFYRHTLRDNPLERIGEQDLTASVNFSALIDYGKDFGFEQVSYERQTNFLFRNGLIERIAAMETGDTIDDLQKRLAIKNLFVPGGVSDNFRVLVQRKP
ncbi:MAG: SAM-dependent methyltransferase [Acidobacteriota bacterium]